MRVNRISNNTNFGKTVRVSMSAEEAHSIIQLVNSKGSNPDKEQLQKDAKEIFNDTYEGHAIVCSPDEGKSIYILSGQEASRFHDIRRKALNTAETISEYYDDGAFLDSNLKYIFKKANQNINSLIKETKENYILSIGRDKEDLTPRIYKFQVVG